MGINSDHTSPRLQMQSICFNRTILESVNKSPSLRSASVSVFIVLQIAKRNEIHFQIFNTIKDSIIHSVGNTNTNHASSCSKRTVKSRLWSCDVLIWKAALPLLLQCYGYWHFRLVFTASYTCNF